MDKSKIEHIKRNDIPPQEIDAQEQADIMNEVRQEALRGMAPSTDGSPTGMLEDEPNEKGPGDPVRKKPS